MKKKTKKTPTKKAKKIILPVEEIPSQITDDYWIYAIRKKGRYPQYTIRSGKWLIFEDITNIDEIWKKIKIALESGLLGKKAKVATAKPNPNATDPNVKVICVYTYDSDDVEDVMKIREELRKIGITKKIPYKTDSATFAKQYHVNGHTRISKYYC